MAKILFLNKEGEVAYQYANYSLTPGQKTIKDFTSEGVNEYNLIKNESYKQKEFKYFNSTINNYVCSCTPAEEYFVYLDKPISVFKF